MINWFVLNVEIPLKEFLKIKLTKNTFLENGSLFSNFLEIFHFLKLSSLLNLNFKHKKPYSCNKINFFSHLHTLIEKKMDKFGKFSSKNIKLAFRVLNNCGGAKQEKQTN